MRTGTDSTHFFTVLKATGVEVRSDGEHGGAMTRSAPEKEDLAGTRKSKRKQSSGRVSRLGRDKKTKDWDSLPH